MNLYHSFIKYCSRFLHSIKKHSLLFIFSLLLGLSPFIFLYVISEKRYKATFTVVYDELVRKIYGDRLLKLNLLIKQHQYSKISDLLKVSKQDASSLVDLEGKNILGEELSKDMNADKIPFTIKLIVTDSAVIPRLQNGIVEFLDEGNEYLSTRKNLKISEINDELQFINNQLELMDSLKRRHYNESINIKKEDKGTVVNAQGSLFDFSYELYKKKEELVKKQKMPEGIQVIDDAFVSDRANKPFLLYLALGILSGLILYIIIVAFLIPVLNYKD